MQTAERLGAMRALAVGLAHEVVPAVDLDACVLRLIAALSAGGPRSLAAVKELLRTVDGAGLAPAVVAATAQAIARQRNTPEAREGLAAFFAKRPPDWTRGPGD